MCGVSQIIGRVWTYSQQADGFGGELESGEKSGHSARIRCLYRCHLLMSLSSLRVELAFHLFEKCRKY